MLIVRYPSGVTLRYNTATYLFRAHDGWGLYTADPTRGGRWVASIQASAGVVVEAVAACAIDKPADQLTGERALQEVVDRIRSFTAHGSLLARLKTELVAFNRRTRRWNQ